MCSTKEEKRLRDIFFDAAMIFTAASAAFLLMGFVGIAAQITSAAALDSALISMAFGLAVSSGMLGLACIEGSRLAELRRPAKSVQSVGANDVNSADRRFNSPRP